MWMIPISVLLTILAYQLMIYQEKELFQQNAEKAYHMVRSRIQLYQNTLITLKSFAEGSQKPISFPIFHAYFHGLNASENLPALHSLNYVLILNHEQAIQRRTELTTLFKQHYPALINCVNQKALPFENLHLILQYREPMEISCNAIGSDLLKLPFRLQTTKEAIQKGLALTPPINLLLDKKQTPALIMMMPVFRKNPALSPENPIMVEGIVSASFKIPVMLNQMFPSDFLSQNYFKIEDITDRKQTYFIYDNQSITQKNLLSEEFDYKANIHLGNRIWHFHVIGLQKFYGKETMLFIRIFIISLILFDIAFFLLMGWYVYAAEQGEQLKTILLEREAILKATGVALFWVKNGKFIWVNERFLEIVHTVRETVLSFSPEMFFLNKQDFEQTLPENNQLFYEKGTISIETQWQTVEKQKIWCWLTGNLIDKNNPDYGILWTLEEISAQKKREQEIYHMAYHDALTGLFNRRAFEEKLNYAFVTAKQHQKKFALFFIDLDHFKDVNDTFGHHIGDLLLIHVAEQIKHSVRDTDLAARLAGDEFVVIVPHFAQRQDLVTLANNLVFNIKGQQFIETHCIPISPSIGIAIFPDHADQIETLQARADTAMYAAKKAGRGQFCFYTPPN